MHAGLMGFAGPIKRPIEPYLGIQPTPQGDG